MDFNMVEDIRDWFDEKGHILKGHKKIIDKPYELNLYDFRDKGDFT